MKEEALALVEGVGDPGEKLNLLREYVQALVLRSLHESEAFRSIAFVGGTALRFIFGLPRFSEDLDFSLEKEECYAPEKWLNKVKSDLSLAGLDLSVSWKDSTTVGKAWIKVGRLLHEAGLAGMPEQKLSIKVEIDTRPPDGAVVEKKVITRHRVIALQHYSMDSLMAGKIHAILTRKYGKGRDWYDLLWYRGHRPPQEPNLMQLQNALDQTQGDGVVDAMNWKTETVKRMEELDWVKLVRDVELFLERREDVGLMTMENMRSILGEDVGDEESA
jgi:hypothetical protein